MKIDLYQMVTDKIIDLLQQGTIPWKKPWNSRLLPMNMVTKKEYRGINMLYLSSFGYKCPCWATFRQINDKKGKITKGEKGTPIIFWNWITIDSANGKDDKTIPFLRYYKVFLM